MEIIWEHSLWLLGPAMGVAGILSLWLYHRDQRLKGASPTVLLLLRFLRFSALVFLLALLLEPFIRQLTLHKEKPILAVVWDDSRSMVLSGDSNEVRALRSDWASELEGLSKDYEIEFLSFGSETRPMAASGVADRFTSFQDLYSSVEERYRNRPLRGIVLASDGIATRSYLPPLDELGVPIITLAAGDTSLRRDVSFGTTRFNSTVFLGNTFPIEATVLSYAMPGEEITVELLEDGIKIDERRFTVREFKHSETLRFVIEAKKEGTRSYSLIISDVEGEISTDNNRKTIFVRVVDKQQKVLMIGAAPHPDMGAIAQALNNSEQFIVEARTQSDALVDLEDHALIIVHSYGNLLSDEWRKLIRNSDLPIWYISGAHDDQLMLAAAENILSVQVEDDKGDEVRATVSNDFVLFEADPEWNTLMRNLPPLQVPFGVYRSGAGANSLLFQKVGSVNTDRPLLSFGMENGRKTAVLIGTGIWRWRLAEYGMRGEQDQIDGLIMKTAIYLATESGEQPLKLFYDNVYDEGDQVRVRAELYNESNERINGPEVELMLREKEGAEYPMLMSRRGDIYELRQSNLPPGSYEMTASTSIGGRDLTTYGSFEVREVLEEIRNLRADHAILSTWSERSNGRFLSLNQRDQLKGSVEELVDTSASLYEETSIDPLVDLKWLLLIPALLLGLEWIIRKWAGSY